MAPPIIAWGAFNFPEEVEGTGRPTFFFYESIESILPTHCKGEVVWRLLFMNPKTLLLKPLLEALKSHEASPEVIAAIHPENFDKVFGAWCGLSPIPFTDKDHLSGTLMDCKGKGYEIRDITDMLLSAVISYDIAMSSNPDEYESHARAMHLVDFGERKEGGRLVVPKRAAGQHNLGIIKRAHERAHERARALYLTLNDHWDHSLVSQATRVTRHKRKSEDTKDCRSVSPRYSVSAHHDTNEDKYFETMTKSVSWLCRN